MTKTPVLVLIVQSFGSRAVDLVIPIEKVRIREEGPLGWLDKAEVYPPPRLAMECAKS